MCWKDLGYDPKGLIFIWYMAELHVSDFVLVGDEAEIRPHESEGKVEVNAGYDGKIFTV